MSDVAVAGSLGGCGRPEGAPTVGWRTEDVKRKMENREPDDTVKEKQIFVIIAKKINQLLETERN